MKNELFGDYNEYKANMYNLLKNVISEKLWRMEVSKAVESHVQKNNSQLKSQLNINNSIRDS